MGKTLSLREMERVLRILSLLLKAVIMIAAVWGISLCAFDMNAFMGGKTVWLYFTIQSNVWIAVTALLGLVMMFQDRRVMPRWMSVLQLMMTVSITLTGLVYCFMLAPLMGEQAFNLTNILTHVLVPAAAVVDFFVCARRLNLRGADTWYVIIPPIYYLGFASIGYVANWQFGPGVNYPYFFLNWGSPAGAFGFSDSLPYMGVMYYVLLMLVFLLLIGRLYVAGANLRNLDCSGIGAVTEPQNSGDCK